MLGSPAVNPNNLASIDAGRRDGADKSRAPLEQRAGVDACDNEGWTALTKAVNDGHIEIVQRLLTQGAGVNALDNLGWTPLSKAVARGRIDIVKLLLLAQGANINVRDVSGRTALMWAVYRGHTETVKLLLQKDADINARDYFGETALTFAADEGYTEIVRLLLAHGGADVNARANAGGTALMKVSRGEAKIIKLLQEYPRTPECLCRLLTQSPNSPGNPFNSLPKEVLAYFISYAGMSGTPVTAQQVENNRNTTITRQIERQKQADEVRKEHSRRQVPSEFNPELGCNIQ